MSEPLPYLYLLSEDDDDDLFYQGCVEKLTQLKFNVQPSGHLRKNGGIAAVRKMLSAFCGCLRASGSMPAFFVVSIDNDRAPEHANDHFRHSGLSSRDTGKGCRTCELENSLREKLGAQEIWPAKGAIAVPVQMLESWLFLIFEAELQEADLPIFSEKKRAAAQTFYDNSVPAQLKDRCGEKRKRSNHSKREFIETAIQQLDPSDLAERSPSFADFKRQVDLWNEAF